ncbi:hypothetical protein EDD16DRAFT_1641411, partial [Pisolithus croceorrhizus]
MFDLLVHAPETTEEPIDSPEFRVRWVRLGYIVCIVLGRKLVFAGLTLGLIGLDELHLRFLATSSETSAKGKTLRKVHGTSLSYRDLLVIINESLPIFLDSAVNTHLIVLCLTSRVFSAISRIVPQAICVRHGLATDRNLNNKKVESIMTSICDEVTLSKDTILDHATVDAILINGYSRIPIHEPGGPLAFQGLLLVKKLLIYDPSKCLPVSHFKLSILPEAHPSINCFQALDYFQTGRAHILLISCNPGIAGGGIGVITLEATAKRLTNAAVMRDIIERERNLTRKTPIEQRTPLLPISLQ